MPVKSKNKVKGFKYYMTLLFAITNILAIVLLLSSFLAWYIPPTKVSFLAYIGLAFPFILLVNICYLIFWFACFKWKLGLVSLASLLICWSPISTYLPLNSKTDVIPEDCIKVLSYNVRVFNWNTEKNAANNPTLKYLKNSGADIICIQEFMSGNNSKLANVKQIKKILEHYPYYSVTNLHHKIKNYNYGLACFSKYPILSTSEIPLGSKDNGAVLYKIKVKGKIISVINNHLESNRITAEDKKLYSAFFKEKGANMFDDVASSIKERLGVAFKVRALQADIVSEYIKKQDTDATIVCGDFNDTPISYAYKKIKGDLNDSFVDSGKGLGITYNENHFLFRIDFILHSKNLKAYNCTVDKVNYSDHYPIWTYLKFVE